MGSSEAARKVLSLDDVLQIIGDEISEIEAVISQLDRNNSHRIDLEKQAAILRDYL